MSEPEKSLILIVDDEPIGRASLEAILAKEGYRLEFAGDGLTAIKMTLTLRPDLVLLDVMMPGMNGFEVTRRLRASSVVAAVPILLVTAMDDIDSRLAGIDAGADDFITKPYDRIELRLRIRTITRLNRFRHLAGKREAMLARDQAETLRDAVIKTALDCIITIDEHGRVIEFNPAAEKMFDRRREDVLGKIMGELIVPPAFREAHARGMRHYLETGHGPVLGKRIEILGMRRDGTEFPIELSIAAIRNQGKLLFTAYIRDISQRKKFERQALVDHNITLAMSDGKQWHEATEAILTVLGEHMEWDFAALFLVDQEVGGLRCMGDWCHPAFDGDEFVRATREVVFAVGEGLPGRVWASGETEWIDDFTGGPVPGPGRKALAEAAGIRSACAFPLTVESRVIGVIKFLSRLSRPSDPEQVEYFPGLGDRIGQFIQRKMSEEEMRRNAAQLNDFFENSTVGIHWLNSAGLVTRINMSEVRLLGFEHADELIGRSICEFHEDQQAVREIMETLRRCGEVREKQIRLRRRDGGLRHAIVNATMAQTDGDGPQIRCFTRDVTDRHVAEQNERIGRRLLESIQHAQSDFIRHGDARQVLGFLLEELLSQTGSEFGFIAEIARDAQGRSLVATRSIKELSVVEGTAVYIERDSLTTLTGGAHRSLIKGVIENAGVVIQNSPVTESRWEGLPKPRRFEIRSHMILPFVSDSRTLGMVVLANRVDGYEEELANLVRPLLSTCEAIIESSRMNQARLDAEAERDRLFNLSLDLICILDPLNRFKRLNPSWSQVLGFEQDQFFSRPIVSFSHPEDAGMLESRLLSLRDQAFESLKFESRMRCFDGSSRLLSWTAVFTPDSGLVYVTARDITEKRRIEQQLEDSASRIQSIFDSAADSIIVIDERGIIESTNNATVKTFGFEQSEMIGRNISMVVPFPHHARHDEYLANYLDTQKARVIGIGREVHAVRRDGSEFPIDLTISEFRVNGRPRFTGIVRDITDRKRIEEHLRASLREKDVLLREIHHRVKNNLQIISSLLELQGSHIDDPGISELFNESKGRVRSMAMIHERLYRSHDLAIVDFSEYVRQLSEDLIQSYFGNPAAISLELDVTIPPLSIDVAIPCGLLLNELISNCLKHGFKEMEPGTIWLNVSRRDHMNELVVADDGRGFPPGVDFRNTASFGLQLVMTLVEQLQGTIELEAARGTRILVRFPA